MLLTILVVLALIQRIVEPVHFKENVSLLIAPSAFPLNTDNAVCSHLPWKAALLGC